MGMAVSRMPDGVARLTTSSHSPDDVGSLKLSKAAVTSWNAYTSDPSWGRRSLGLSDDNCQRVHFLPFTFETLRFFYPETRLWSRSRWGDEGTIPVLIGNGTFLSNTLSGSESRGANTVPATVLRRYSSTAKSPSSLSRTGRPGRLCL